MNKALVVLGGPTWPSLLEPLSPGAHVAVLADDVDLDGFRGRSAGLELRDTLLVLSAGVASRFVLLFRKPLEEATVAEQVLATGTGGINIEACRVGSTKDVPASPSRTKGDSFSGSVDGSLRRETGEEGGHNPNIGRWPPNMLLVHGGGCREIVKFKPSNGSGVASEPEFKPMNRSIFGRTNTPGRTLGYVGEDGTEMISDWQCQPNCPARLLNEQTGVLTSGSVAEHHMRNASTQPSNGGFNGKFGDMPLMGYGDSGGASRFFPQFKDDYELVAWIRRLISP